jgi:hypothetical protein
MDGFSGLVTNLAMRQVFVEEADIFKLRARLLHSPFRPPRLLKNYGTDKRTDEDFEETVGPARPERVDR